VNAIDPALRQLQDQPLYCLAPVNPTSLVAVHAPLSPTALYQTTVGGKLTKDSIVHEFVLVKTWIQQLEHNLQLANNENTA
jgi:hypothetical protein